MVAGGGEEKEEEDMNMKILLESALLREVKGWFEKVSSKSEPSLGRLGS